MFRQMSSHTHGGQDIERNKLFVRTTVTLCSPHKTAIAALSQSAGPRALPFTHICMGRNDSVSIVTAELFIPPAVTVTGSVIPLGASRKTFTPAERTISASRFIASAAVFDVKSSVSKEKQYQSFCRSPVYSIL